MSKPWSDLFRDVYTFPKREVKPNYRNWDLNLVCQLHFLCCLPLGQLCTCFYLMETKSCNRSLKEKKSNQKKKKKERQNNLVCIAFIGHYWSMVDWIGLVSAADRHLKELSVIILSNLFLYIAVCLFISIIFTYARFFPTLNKERDFKSFYVEPDLLSYLYFFLFCWRNWQISYKFCFFFAFFSSD